MLRHSPRYLLYHLSSKNTEESDVFKSLYYVFRKAERKRKRLALFRRSHNFLVLRKRSLNYGRLHITHRRRNTFASYSQGDFEDPFYNRILSKASCGHFYRGIKKPTRHARETVLKTIGSFVGKERTSTLDIFLTSGSGKIYKYLLRAFRIEPVYIRYLLVTRRRSHGFTRARKPRRT
jgi:hypothetical protein